jgi:hypothetical protein
LAGRIICPIGAQGEAVGPEQHGVRARPARSAAGACLRLTLVGCLVLGHSGQSLPLQALSQVQNEVRWMLILLLPRSIHMLAPSFQIGIHMSLARSQFSPQHCTPLCRPKQSLQSLEVQYLCRLTWFHSGRSSTRRTAYSSPGRKLK